MCYKTMYLTFKPELHEISEGTLRASSTDLNEKKFDIRFLKFARQRKTFNLGNNPINS